MQKEFILAVICARGPWAGGSLWCGFPFGGNLPSVFVVMAKVLIPLGGIRSAFGRCRCVTTKFLARRRRMLRIAKLGCAAGLAVFAAIGSSASFGAEVELVGVLGGKAVLVIDGGGPKTFAVGERSRDGVKLIEVGGEIAVVEVDGARRRIGLGQAALRVDSAPLASAAVNLFADPSGHHFANGAINGAAMRFLVDTGASMVSIGLSDARRAGIDYRRGVPARTQTASGPAVVWRVRLDAVRVGDITLHGVDGLVHENELPFVLLGMSFLNRMDMQRERERLILRKRY